MPTLQVAAAAGKFQGTRKGMPTMTAEEIEAAKKHLESLPAKKPVIVPPSSALATVVFSDKGDGNDNDDDDDDDYDDEDDGPEVKAADDQYRPGRKTNEEKWRPTAGVIGGIGPSGNPWKSTAQRQNDGEPTEKPTKLPKNVKAPFDPANPVQLISPITGAVIGDYGDWMKIAAKKGQASANVNEDEKEEEMGSHALLTKLKEGMAKHGASGLVGLARTFKLMDSDGSGTLSLKEFKRAIKRLHLGLPITEVKELFGLFGTSFSYHHNLRALDVS